METVQEQYKDLLTSFKYLITAAAEKKFEAEKQLAATAFALITKDGKPTIAVIDMIGCLFDSEEGKESAEYILRQMTKDMKPIAIAFLSEGWGVQTDTKEEILNPDGSYKPGMKPEENPNRKEVLFINFETGTEESQVIYDVIRHDENNPTLEKKTDTEWKLKSGSTEGMFTNLINEDYEDYLGGVNTDINTK